MGNLNLRKLEEEGAKKTLVRHGVHAFIRTGIVPMKVASGRAWKRELARIGQIRENVVKELGGDKIKPSVLALVEAAMEALTIQKLSLLYIKKAGILRRDAYRRGDLQLHSVLSGQFISYGNAVRLNLEAAHRLAREKEIGEAPPAEFIVIGDGPGPGDGVESSQEGRAIG